MSRRCGGGLWDTRSVSPLFNPPSHVRDSPVSNAVIPSRRFQFILRCSFHCAHFIVLISLCSFPRWQLDVGRDLLGSHCFSAKITQPLYSPLCCIRMIGVSSGSGPAFLTVLITFSLFHAQIACFTSRPLPLRLASLLSVATLLVERSLLVERCSIE